MDAASLKKRLLQEISKGIKTIIKDILLEAVEGIKGAILEEYDSILLML